MKRLIQAIRRPVQARIKIPGSKSITNRALLLAALANGVSEISSILVSDDTVTFINALRQLGVMVQFNEATQTCIVGGSSGHFPKKEASIWCKDAGTAARFLLAACAASPGKYTFDGGERLRERPIISLLNILHMQGARILPPHATQMPFTLEGREKLLGGEIEIDGSESGQFISALLMAAPFAQAPTLLKTSHLVSRSYVEMTCTMMAEFGVLVRRLHQERFSIPVPQRYTARDYVVEPDLTTASYFFAAAAVTGGQVIIQPIDIKHSTQGDAKFLTVLEKMGCIVTETATGLMVKGPAELRGVSVDMRHFSDTFMTLAAIAPFASTPTTITNIRHTRLQESNRITVMREELTKLNVKAEEGPDWIKIYPSQPVFGTINAHHDHRIAMAFSIMGLRTGVQIEGAQCVSKTCPAFFELWDELYPVIEKNL
ncbi:MAG TPA: 3-phosphoshikimate 1-carboxyvinyltransferase [Gammaproteobacteria bacterium]|nr:3-phosphoshikimate 1-carboxyvinyltransferase [Gammaproteobacteria bacterium]